MAVKGRAVHKNHNPTLYIDFVISLKQFCPIIVACPGHILESIKGIVIKLGTYMRGSAEDKNHNPILHFPLVISLYYFS